MMHGSIYGDNGEIINHDDMRDRIKSSQAQGNEMKHQHDLSKAYIDIHELTDRLAKAEKERDKAIAERDELKRGKSCDGCEYEWRPDLPGRCPISCERQKYPDYFKPRDPSAEQGGME